jgi:hypothetical protein
MSVPLKPREGFCSFLDKRTKIKTAVGLFSALCLPCKSGRSIPKALGTNLLPYFVPAFLCFSKILKAHANTHACIFCSISSEASLLSKKNWDLNPI